MELTLSKHRVEGLTDGIFAIVMTLIVLELKVPELERHAPDAEILGKIRDLGPQFLAFFLTFSLAGLFWFLHHSTMQFIKHVIRPLVLINLLFLMLVSLLPFSAAMLGRFLRAPVALEIYYGHQFVLGSLLGIQWQIARSHDLFTDALTPELRRVMPFRLWTIPIACLTALSTALAWPEYAQSAFVVTVLAGRLASKKS